jgi:GxxExxY protein
METDLAEVITAAAIEVHRHLGGPGLLENIYEAALCHELSLRNLHTQRQMPIPVCYKGVPVRDPVYLDILVEKQVIIEVKASPKDYPYYPVQLLTYLRLANLHAGLLINFGKQSMKDGIQKVVNVR